MNELTASDVSLLEVRQWREKLSLLCEHMSPEEEIAYIHNTAQKLIKNYSLKLRYAHSGKRELAPQV
jgi:hypothetical protein